MVTSFKCCFKDVCEIQGSDHQACLGEREKTFMTFIDTIFKLFLIVSTVDEWRTKWHLGNKWYESSVEDLVRDMSDINEHVRLQTIATIARAATFRPPDAPGIPVKSKI